MGGLAAQTQESTPAQATFEFAPFARRPWLKWALIVGVWALFGSVIAGEQFFASRARGGDLTLARSLMWFLAYGLSWALFTPLVLWLRRRFPLEKGRWASSLAVHVPVSILIAWAGTTVWVAVGQMLGLIPAGTDVLIQRSLMTFVVFLHFDPFLYWIIIGLSYVAQYYKESRERELRASQLETQLAESRLKALEMQLHPHFLFNALHTIAVLVRTNRNSQAVRVVTGLGELLRRALDSAGAQVVPLKQELEFIERYLEIEQLRFGDRLKVEMRIEPQTLDARVPYLILQPLVENAIRHGIAARLCRVVENQRAPRGRPATARGPRQRAGAGQEPCSWEWRWPSDDPRAPTPTVRRRASLRRLQRR